MKISITQKQHDWIFRVLIAISIWQLLAGYLDWIQTKRQLLSPLIPKSTTAQIIGDNVQVAILEKFIWIGVMMLIAMWLYTFQKRMAANILLAISILYSIFYQFNY